MIRDLCGDVVPAGFPTGFLAAAATVMVAVLTPSGVHAAPAAALGPEVTVGEPSGGYVGQLDVTPLHAPAGTPVTVTATGLPPGQQFQLAWATARGAWKVTEPEYHGREFTPAAYQIAQPRSDASGRLAVTFTAPDDYGFMHDIVLQQGARLLTQAAFDLDMTIEVSPRSGPPGTPITLDVKGIGYRSLYNSWDVIYDNAFTGWMSSVTTGGAARFTIPATGGPGVHVIEVMHGELTFPYRNPEQNPVPGRPRFAFEFTVTDGAPVLPAPPAEQGQHAVRRLPPPGDIAAEPPFAGVGEPTTAHAAGLVPGTTYTLNFSRVVGNRMTGQGWEENAIAVASSAADASGRAEFHFATPDDLGGGHGLWIDAGTAKKTGSLWIKPTALPMDVTRGPAGTPFTIHLKGVGWTETSNLYTVVYDNGLTGYVCAFNSQGDVALTMRATGAPGVHYIDLYPGIYRGTETRPNNFRIPQLTYADDHPGEDLPAFHFGFEVTAPAQRAALER